MVFGGPGDGSDAQSAGRTTIRRETATTRPNLANARSGSSWSREFQHLCTHKGVGSRTTRERRICRGVLRNSTDGPCRVSQRPLRKAKIVPDTVFRKCIRDSRGRSCDGASRCQTQTEPRVRNDNARLPHPNREGRARTRDSLETERHVAFCFSKLEYLGLVFRKPIPTR